LKNKNVITADIIWVSIISAVVASVIIFFLFSNLSISKTGDATKIIEKQNDQIENLLGDLKDSGKEVKNCFILPPSEFVGQNNITLYADSYNNNTGCFEISDDIFFNNTIILDASKGPFTLRGAGSGINYSTLNNILVDIPAIEFKNSNNSMDVIKLEKINIFNRSGISVNIANKSIVNINKVTTTENDIGFNFHADSCAHIYNSTVSNSDTGYYVISSSKCSNKIMNSSSENNSSGITILGDDNLKQIELNGFIVKNNTIGLSIFNAKNVLVKNSYFENNIQKGMFLSNITSDSVIIEKSEINNSEIGLELFNSKPYMNYLKVSDNLTGIKADYTNSYYPFNGSGVLENSQVFNNLNTGIDITYVLKDTDMFYLNNVTVYNNGVGISADNIKLKNSNVSYNTTTGLLLKDGAKFLIENCNFSNNQKGVVYFSNSNVFSDNKISGSRALRNSQVGFDLTGVGTIENSVANNNSSDGFVLSEGFIGKNLVASYNGRYGIHVKNSSELRVGAIACNNKINQPNAADIFGNGTLHSNLTGDFYYDTLIGNASITQVDFCKNVPINVPGIGSINNLHS
jgi:hypothetical protein